MLLAGASAALAGCGLESWFEQPGRRIFRRHLGYSKPDGSICAFARGGASFYSLEAAKEATEVSPAMFDLCRVDLDSGKATPLRRLERTGDLLAISDEHAWFVRKLDAVSDWYLYRAPLVGNEVAEKLFKVPSRNFLVADGRSAWTYRMDQYARTDLVRVTGSTVETLVQNVEPGELTASVHGLFFAIESGLHFVAQDGKPTRIADRDAVPLVGGDRPMLSWHQRLSELELPSGKLGQEVGDASHVPGQPCAARCGGVLCAAVDGSMPGLPSRVGTIALNFWEAGTPGWDVAMEAVPGRMLFGAVHGPSYVLATESWVAELF